MRRLLRAFLDWQFRLSHAADRVLPLQFRTVGREHFRASVLPAHVERGQVVYDVGGGSLPCLSVAQKTALGARLIGVDISAEEMSKAAPGAYDKTIVTDIARFTGAGDADLIVSQATMEHVRDTDAAFRAFTSMLKPGGRLLMVTPSRNAIFARVNLLLPEKMKRRLLYFIFPSKSHGHDGFPAFYDRCTPRQFRRMAEAHGLEVEELTPYYYSSYFSFFLPIFILWRIWILLFWLIRREQAAEVFSIVCRKRRQSASAS